MLEIENGELSESKSDIPPIEVEVQIRKSAKGSVHIIDVDEDVAQHFLQHDQKRVLLHFPNGTYFHRAFQKSKGLYYISLGQGTVREARVQVGEILTIRIEADTSKYGMPFPEEFEEVLDQDFEAQEKWEALTPGLKRSVLHYISSGKHVDTRIQRSIYMAEKMKRDEMKRH